MGLVLAGLGSLAASLLLTPLAVRAGAKARALDLPGRLKVHTTPISYLGGVAVFVPVAVVVAWVRPALVAPLAVALAVGLADDRWGMGPIPRILAGLVVGALVAVAVPLPDPTPAWAVAVVVLTVVLMNAVNLLDGLDALAGGVGTAAALGFAVLLEGDGRVVALGLAGALAGFLVFNRPPARVYLGDGGAYLLGATLASLVAFAGTPPQPTTRFVGALLLVAVPLADLAVTVIRRTRAGRHIFTGDRGHVYDQLMDRGLHPTRATLLLVLAQAVLVGVGVLLGRVTVGIALASAALVAMAMLLAAAVGGFLSPDYRRSVARDDDQHSNLPGARLRVHR